MEKFGVDKQILHEDLRNEEAMLMQKVQSTMMDKTAAEEYRNWELRLQQVRSKLTELDLKDSPQNLVED